MAAKLAEYEVLSSRPLNTVEAPAELGNFASLVGTFWNAFGANATGTVVTGYLYTNNLVRDREAFAAYYSANKQIIDAYFAQINYARAAQVSEVQSNLNGYALTFAAGAVVGAGLAILFRKKRT